MRPGPSRRIREWAIALMPCALFVVSSSLGAQVVHVAAGMSTAERAGGSLVRFWYGRSDGWFSAGDAGPDGGAGIAGYFRRRYRDWTLEIGDVEIPVVLDTDLFGGGAGIPLRGVGYNRSTERVSWSVHGGGTTHEIAGPSFRSATVDRGALAFRLDARLGEDVTLSSRAAVSERFTSVQSVRWRINDGTDVAIAGGVGGGDPYAATSIVAEREALSFRGAWIHASDRFRRQVARRPDAAEPDGLNAAMTLRPTSHLLFTAGRHSYLIAETPTSAALRYAVHTIGVQRRQGALVASISGHDAAVGGGRTRGLWARAAYTPHGRFGNEISLLASDPALGESNTALSLGFSQRVTQRLSLTQSLMRSAGHTSISFGGELITNPVRARIEYRTMFVPVTHGSAFQQAMVIQTEILPAGDLKIDVGTHIRPDGQVVYRVSAGTWLNTSGAAERRSPIRIHRYMIRGRVIDESGVSIAGAALRVAEQLVFTNSAGEFFVRVRNRTPQDVRLEPSEFMTSIRYEAVSAPERVAPAEMTTVAPVTFIVRRTGGQQAGR